MSKFFTLLSILTIFATPAMAEYALEIDSRVENTIMNICDQALINKFELNGYEVRASLTDRSLDINQTILKGKFRNPTTGKDIRIIVTHAETAGVINVLGKSETLEKGIKIAAIGQRCYVMGHYYQSHSAPGSLISFNTGVYNDMMEPQIIGNYFEKLWNK